MTEQQRPRFVCEVLAGDGMLAAARAADLEADGYLVNVECSDVIQVAQPNALGGPPSIGITPVWSIVGQLPRPNPIQAQLLEKFAQLGEQVGGMLAQENEREDWKG